jgi:lia operon protein LiaG
MRYKVEDGVLKIQFAKSNLKLKGIFKSLNKDLTINIPVGMALANVKIDTVSANIDMESTTADRFDLVTVSGDINGAMLKGNSMDAENVSGEIRWTDGTFRTVTGNSVSGDINTTFAAMPSDITMETVSGGMTLGLPKNDGFTVDYDKVSGDFNCAFSVQMDKNSAIYKSGINKIKLETVSGDMKILAL